MTNTLRITYHYNSGFSIHLGDVLLVFDYWEGAEGSMLIPAARLSTDSLATYRRIYVFVSTSRADHIDDKIYEWQKRGLLSSCGVQASHCMASLVSEHSL